MLQGYQWKIKLDNGEVMSCSSFELKNELINLKSNVGCH